MKQEDIDQLAPVGAKLFEGNEKLIRQAEAASLLPIIMLVGAVNDRDQLFDGNCHKVTRRSNSELAFSAENRSTLRCALREHEVQKARSTSRRCSSSIAPRFVLNKSS